MRGFSCGTHYLRHTLQNVFRTKAVRPKDRFPRGFLCAPAGRHHLEVLCNHQHGKNLLGEGWKREGNLLFQPEKLRCCEPFIAPIWSYPLLFGCSGLGLGCLREVERLHLCFRSGVRLASIVLQCFPGLRTGPLSAYGVGGPQRNRGSRRDLVQGFGSSVCMCGEGWCVPTQFHWTCVLYAIAKFLHQAVLCAHGVVLDGSLYLGWWALHICGSVSQLLRLNLLFYRY